MKHVDRSDIQDVLRELWKKMKPEKSNVAATKKWRENVPDLDDIFGYTWSPTK